MGCCQKALRRHLCLSICLQRKSPRVMGGTEKRGLKMGDLFMLDEDVEMDLVL